MFSSSELNVIIIAVIFNQSGADMTLRDSNGDSALHWAAYKVKT